MHREEDGALTWRGVAVFVNCPTGNDEHITLLPFEAGTADYRCALPLEDMVDCTAYMPVVLGDSLEHMTHLFEPGIWWLLCVEVSPPEIMLILYLFLSI